MSAAVLTTWPQSSHKNGKNARAMWQTREREYVGVYWQSMAWRWEDEREDCEDCMMLRYEMDTNGKTMWRDMQMDTNGNTTMWWDGYANWYEREYLYVNWQHSPKAPPARQLLTNDSWTGIVSEGGRAYKYQITILRVRTSAVASPGFDKTCFFPPADKCVITCISYLSKKHAPEPWKHTCMALATTLSERLSVLSTKEKAQVQAYAWHWELHCRDNTTSLHYLAAFHQWIDCAGSERQYGVARKAEQQQINSQPAPDPGTVINAALSNSSTERPL